MSSCVVRGKSHISHAITIADHVTTRSKLNDDERKGYLDAVSCLHATLPNLIISKLYSRASHFRIDDFLLTHTYYSFQNLFSGLSLHYNRWFLAIYDTVLRDECKYPGALPYWDFSEFSDDITKDPILSNSATSLGGNGAPYPNGNGPVQVTYFGHNLTIPPGSGGGCIYDAPFKGTTYNSDPTETSVYPWPLFDGTSNPIWWFTNPLCPYNPNDRCISRDFNVDIGKDLRISRIEEGLSCPDVGCFLSRVAGAVHDHDVYPFNIADTARFAIGGLQLDPITAPNDPIWWLMQANVDRLYSIWQNQDPDVRMNQINGTITPFNDISNTQYQKYYDDPITLGTRIPLHELLLDASQRSLRDVANTTNELICYYYE
ncbi:Di-copper centre-containing protein [Pleomassaria siparia CBS 279.74]|uniref:Di-copper centre-containing protein n=1 Tax=Pleomassaria siparia CBS 279.74 TaxID=1314801 RepID=A0A6G1KGG9_9PLEO|nr:Di-copper centre-containing protein [Pleomassaria siparia CBS 279.74]